MSGECVDTCCIIQIMITSFYWPCLAHLSDFRHSLWACHFSACVACTSLYKHGKSQKYFCINTDGGKGATWQTQICKRQFAGCKSECGHLRGGFAMSPVRFGPCSESFILSDWHFAWDICVSFSRLLASCQCCHKRLRWLCPLRIYLFLLR